MSTNFKVNNLIANNVVYSTGNQTISGIKTFNSVINGNISTLKTGTLFAEETQENQIPVWKYGRRYEPAEDGFMVLHNLAASASVEKEVEWTSYLENNSQDFLINKELYGRDLQIYPQGGAFGGSILKVYASVSLERKRINVTPNVTEFFHGLYTETFLVGHKDPTYTTFNPIYINNVANTENIVNIVVDQTVNKPSSWVSLVSAGDSLYLRFRSHISPLAGYEYMTFIKVYLKNYE